MALPLVQVVEPDGIGVGLVKWGNRFSGALPGTAGVLFSILQADKLPGPPRAIAVNLFRSDRQSGVAGENSDVYAEIQYGAGGVRNTFRCDWLSGSQITLVCNAITIYARTYAPAPDATYQAVTNIVLGATIGLGPAPTSTAPTYSFPRYALAALQSRALPIPDFARRVRVYRPSATNSEVNLVFERSSPFGATTPVSQGFTPDDTIPPNTDSGLVIPGGANELLIQNSGVGPQTLTVQFDLGI
jgi:hypothetical protein